MDRARADVSEGGSGEKQSLVWARLTRHYRITYWESGNASALKVPSSSVHTDGRRSADGKTASIRREDESILHTLNNGEGEKENPFQNALFSRRVPLSLSLPLESFHREFAVRARGCPPE